MSTTREAAQVLAKHWHDYDADCYGVENYCGECGDVSSISAHQVQELAKAGLLRGDEDHTMDDLYYYRMLYNAHAIKAWTQQGITVKSWRHSDGEPCFGGGWFIVAVNLHPHGWVTNHYEAKHWDLFDAPEHELGPEWDGHTPAQAAERLLAALTEEES